MKTGTIVKAINNLNPGAEFTFENDDLSTLVWLKNEETAPTIKQIQDEIKAILAIEKAEEATRLAVKGALLQRLGITEEEAKLLLS